MQKYSYLSHGLIGIGLICLLGFSPVLTAAMYKWIDADGNTHYTQSPPPGGVEGDTVKPPSKVDVEGAQKELDEQKKRANKLSEQRMESKEQAAKSEQETVEKTEKCEQAKKRLASYQRPRVNIKQADGSSRSIPEEKRQAEIKKSEDYIKKLCN